MEPASFLITGATGKQGRSVIKALLSHPSFSASKHIIYGVTRDPSSSSSQRVASLSSAIRMIKGDLGNASAIFASLPASGPPLRGVFSVQGLSEDEVAQAVGLIDAAAAAATADNGPLRIVQASVERGGEAPTDVPHFRTKWQIEQHLEKAVRDATVEDRQLRSTVLRPVFFLDNLAQEGFGARVAATAWRDRLNPGQKLQVVDTADIGAWAADALLSKNDENHTISLAGDELSFDEADEIFRRETGMPIPTTYSWIVSFMFWFMDDISKMYEFFREKGSNADIQALREQRPMTDFTTFVRNSSYVKKDN